MPDNDAAVVDLVPLKSTWTCPACQRQNLYVEGVVSVPQNKCSACGTEVQISHINPADFPIPAADAAVEAAIRERYGNLPDGVNTPHTQQENDVLALLATCDGLRAEVERLNRQNNALANANAEISDECYRARSTAISDCIEKVYGLRNEGDGWPSREVVAAALKAMKDGESQ